MRRRSAGPFVNRARISRAHLSYANVMSTLAVLIALVGGGAAYAAATVGSRDVINNSLKSVDIKDDSSEGGGLQSEDIAVDALTENDLGPASVTSGELSPLAFFDPDIARAQSGLFAIPNDAIQSAEVEDASLTGFDVADGSIGTADINESSLTPLDGHDSYDAECDPGTSTAIMCDELTFTLGRPMEVSASWTYGFGTDGGDPPGGGCTTTLNGAAKSGEFILQSEDDSDYNIGGKPILDVMNLPAGTHTIGFRCDESAPDHFDIVIRDLYMSVVELGFD
ncbi:MAG: hypothetical protein M3280_00490 [Actinomycetota bacterium]|nr:hypothetical protein [Actinomycetota bacterium]